MDGLAVFYATYPFWTWLAFAAVLLVAEVATGSGWLLWPAGSAAAVAVISVTAPLGPEIEVVLFALATLASTYLGRRYLRPPADQGRNDLNDPAARLIGQEAEVLSAFVHGHGRVFADGKEWAAVGAHGFAPEIGQTVRVAAVDGARLRVR